MSHAQKFWTQPKISTLYCKHTSRKNCIHSWKVSKTSHRPRSLFLPYMQVVIRLMLLLSFSIYLPGISLPDVIGFSNTSNSTVCIKTKNKITRNVNGTLDNIPMLTPKSWMWSSYWSMAIWVRREEKKHLALTIKQADCILYWEQ